MGTIIRISNVFRPLPASPPSGLRQIKINNKTMKIYLGETGLNKSWQKDFKANTKCHKCKGNARIMFVAFENMEKEYICNLHPNTGARKNGKYWLHDACSCASYLCEKCFEVTSILNQA